MSNYSVATIKPFVKGGDFTTFKINSSTEEVLRFIKLIENEMVLPKPSFQKLKDCCFELIRRLPLPTYILKDTFLVRSRENFKGEVFNSVSQLSYNPFAEKIPPGRFNLEKEAVFYATVPTCSHGSSGQLTAICETCKELFDVNSHFSIKHFTTGRWQIVKPLRFIALTFDEKVEKQSFHIQNINQPFLSALSTACSYEDYCKCLSFFSLISECASSICSDEIKYLLTTAFFHAAKKYYNNKLGILYSSSVTDNKGLNIVLPRELINKNFLQLDVVAMFKAIRNPNNFKSYTIGPCTREAYVNGNNKFEFKNIW